MKPDGTELAESIVVKEIYKSDRTTLNGYALDAKIVDADGGDSWVFFEGLAPNFDNVYGIGSGSCTPCHEAGTDFLRADLP